MPICPYCKCIPTDEYCPDFYTHVRACQEEARYALEKSRAEYDKQQALLGKITQTTDSAYLDYPQNDMTSSVIWYAHHVDLNYIKDVDDLDRIICTVHVMKNKQITRILSGSDKLAKSQVMSCLADFVRIIRTRILNHTNDSPTKIHIIKATEDFEAECLRDKSIIKALT
jgi:hypothetical protein